MKRARVESSLLWTVGYDPETLTLELEFKSGRVYQYFHVPGTVFESFVASESLGAFFNSQIRDSYGYSRIDVRPE